MLFTQFSLFLHVFKARESPLACEDVDVNLSGISSINYLIRLGLSQSGALSEYSLVGLITVNVTLRMHELTASSVGAELFLVELFTCFCHVVGRKVSLLY